MNTEQEHLPPCPLCGGETHFNNDDWIECGSCRVATNCFPNSAASLKSQNHLNRQGMVMDKLFCDLKTDEEKAAFFLSGRGYETGVIAQSIQNDVAMAYHRCAEYKKELEALQSQDREDAARYRRLRDGQIDDIAVVRGLGATDYGASVVIGTYEEEIDGDDLDEAIDHARRAKGERNDSHTLQTTRRKDAGNRHKECPS